MILRRGTCLREVGTINREVQHIKPERLTKTVGGEIPRRVMTARNPRQEARQYGEFAGEQGFQDALLCFLQHWLEPWRSIAELAPDFIEPIETVAHDQHLRDSIQPFITSRA